MEQKLIIGVDVSKLVLDFVEVSDARSWSQLSKCKAQQIPNTQDAIREWLLTYQGREIYVVFEATGTYSDKLSCMLEEAWVPFSVVNPKHSSDTAKSLQITHRTDQNSAQVLAFMGAWSDLPLYQGRSPEQRTRKQLLTAVLGLEKQIQSVSNRLEAQQQYTYPCLDVIALYEEQLQQLEKHLQRLRKKLRNISDTAFEQQKKLAMTVVGIGPASANWLLTYMGSIDQFESSKKLIKYCGLAGSSHQSGSSVKTKKGVGKQASAKMRSCLYMATKSAIRYNHACKELYKRLRAKGKSYYKAVVAVMAKLVKQVFAVLKSGVPFDNHYYLKWK